MTLPQNWSCLDATDKQQLLRWHQEGADLAFVYARFLGGLMQTGRCHIARPSQEFKTLGATGSKLVIALLGAGGRSGNAALISVVLRHRYLPAL